MTSAKIKISQSNGNFMLVVQVEGSETELNVNIDEGDAQALWAEIHGEKPNAKKVADYFKVYQAYLIDNNLDDDSKTISVKALVNFVENVIDAEDVQKYLTMGKVLG